MKRAREYLTGFKRSIARFLPSSVFRLPGTPPGTVYSSTADGSSSPAKAVGYLTSVVSRAGFLTAEEAAQAASDYVALKSSWHKQLILEAQQYCVRGLPIYDRSTGPLAGGLDWSALDQWSIQDRLYKLRPHRFGFLPRLAMAAACGTDCLPALLATLEGWIVHLKRRSDKLAYYSNLVAIYRIIAITWAAPFCLTLAEKGAKSAPELCLRLVEILATDVRHVWQERGGAATNNHLLADRFAAWLLATCYPDLVPGGQAGNNAEEFEQEWLPELTRQFEADGTNFEQSIHYHELGCEMAIAYLAIQLRRGAQLLDNTLVLIRSMLRFQATLAGDVGRGFVLGDGTEDPLLPLNDVRHVAGGAWRVLYNALFDPSFPATARTAHGAERAFWVLRGLSRIDQPLTQLSPPAPRSKFEVFPDGGYILVADSYQNQDFLFRTGPRHGVTVHPGHAMSDLLSVYWTAAGQPILEPSGTYSYTAGPAHGEGPRSPRAHFRGPRASNGIVLTGHDPLGIARGRFRGHDIGARVASRWAHLDGVLGWAEGQLQEPGPLRGYRRGIVHIPGQFMIIYDRLPPLPEGARLFAHWQAAPEANVQLRDTLSASLCIGDHRAFICGAGHIASLTCHQGEVDPPAGWISRSYGCVQAAPQLIATLAAPAQDLVFVIGLKHELPSIRILQSTVDGIALEIRWDDHWAIACVGRASLTASTSPLTLEFHGLVGWLSLREDRCVEVRALGLKRLHSHALGLDLDRHVGRSEAWRLAEPHESDGTQISGRWRYTDDN